MPRWRRRLATAAPAVPCPQVQQLLRDIIYFVPADTRLEVGKPVGDSPKWTLAVLRPLRWGIVGNGLIGEVSAE